MIVLKDVKTDNVENIQEAELIFLSVVSVHTNTIPPTWHWLHPCLKTFKICLILLLVILICFSTKRFFFDHGRLGSSKGRLNRISSNHSITLSRLSILWSSFLRLSKFSLQIFSLFIVILDDFLWLFSDDDILHDFIDDFLFGCFGIGHFSKLS